MAILTLADYHSLTNSDSTYDSLVNSLLAPVQAQIELYCDRTFDIQDYYEWYTYYRTIALTQYPINAIKFIGYLQYMALFEPAVGYNYEITSTGITITNDSNLSSTTFAFATYTTLTALKTAIEAAIPAITLTIESGYESTYYKLLREGTGTSVYGAVRNNCVTQLKGNRSLNFLESYTQLATLDVYSCTPVFVIWSAGYATADMPQGLKLIMANIVKDLITYKTEIPKAGLLKSESMTLTNADYSYTVADNSAIQQIISNNYKGELDYYRKVSI